MQYVGRVATATACGFLAHNGFTTSAALAFYLLLALLPRSKRCITWALAARKRCDSSFRDRYSRCSFGSSVRGYGPVFSSSAYISAMYGTLTSAVAILLGAELNVQVKQWASSGKSVSDCAFSDCPTEWTYHRSRRCI